jgi:hypothetical protein
MPSRDLERRIARLEAEQARTRGLLAGFLARYAGIVRLDSFFGRIMNVVESSSSSIDLLTYGVKEQAKSGEGVEGWSDMIGGRAVSAYNLADALPRSSSGDEPESVAVDRVVLVWCVHRADGTLEYWFDVAAGGSTGLDRKVSILDLSDQVPDEPKFLDQQFWIVNGTAAPAFDDDTDVGVVFDTIESSHNEYYLKGYIRLDQLTGFDSGEALQSLKNIDGEVQWVDDYQCPS